MTHDSYSTRSLAMLEVFDCFPIAGKMYMPVSGGFISLAGKWVDDAWGFMAGWNFSIYMALTVHFEISAVSLLLGYWRDDIPVIAICLACIAAYANVLTPSHSSSCSRALMFLVTQVD